MKTQSLIITLLIITLISFSSAYDYCSSGNQGSRLEISSITDNLKDNPRALYWDEEQSISIKVKVKNNLEYVEDFMVEVIFVDSKNEEVDITEEDLEEEFNLKNGESEELKFNFKVEDEVATGTYTMYVKYYVDGEESKLCKQITREIKIGSINKCTTNSGSIEITGFKDNKEDNHNSWEWKTKDEVGISFYIKNKGPTSDFDIILIFLDNDENGIEITEEDLEKSETISKGDEEEVEFNFKLEDIPSGYYGMYLNVVKDNSTTCTSKKISGNGDTTFILIEDIDRIELEEIIGSRSVTKGDSINYKVKIKNTGLKKQSKILITYSSANTKEQTKIVENVNSNSTVEYNFTINFQEVGIETLLFKVDYDYEEDYKSADIYRLAVNVLEKEKPIEKKIEVEEIKEEVVIKSETNTLIESEEEGFGLWWILIIIVFVILIIVAWKKLKDTSDMGEDII